MKQIAFVNRTSPHGRDAGRESLDALLATSALCEEDLSVFFIEDGVYQLLDQQQPDTIPSRNYSATFKMLALYEIEPVYVCQDSLAARGLSADDLLLDEITLVSRAQVAQLLDQQAVVLHF